MTNGVMLLYFAGLWKYTRIINNSTCMKLIKRSIENKKSVKYLNTPKSRRDTFKTIDLILFFIGTHLNVL